MKLTAYPDNPFYYLLVYIIITQDVKINLLVLNDLNEAAKKEVKLVLKNKFIFLDPNRSICDKYKAARYIADILYVQEMEEIVFPTLEEFCIGALKKQNYKFQLFFIVKKNTRGRSEKFCRIRQKICITFYKKWRNKIVLSTG